MRKETATIVFLLLAAAVFLFFGFRDLNIIRSYPTATATVEHVNVSYKHTDSGDKKKVTADIAFEIDGERHTDLLTRPPAGVHEGQVLEIRYDPHDPQYTYLTNETVAYVCLGVGGAFAFLLLVTLLVPQRKKD